MSVGEDLMRQLEDFVVAKLNDGHNLKDIFVSDLYKAFPESGYENCALWLDVYKERFGVADTTPPPEWFNVWVEQLQAFTGSMWPRINETLQYEIFKVRREEEARHQELEGNLKDAHGTIIGLEADKAGLSKELEAARQLIANQEQGMADLRKLNEELSGAKVKTEGDQDETEPMQPLIDALEASHQLATTELKEAHEQTVSTLNGHLEQVTKERDSLKLERDNLLVSRNETSIERDNLMVDRDKLVGELDVANTSLKAANKDLLEVRAQLETVNSSSAATTEKLTKVVEELATANGCRKDLEVQVKELKSNQSPDAKKLERVTQKNADLKAEVKELNTRIKGHESREEQLINQTVSLQEQSQKATERLFAASDAQIKAESEVEVLRVKLETFNAQKPVRAQKKASPKARVKQDSKNDVKKDPESAGGEDQLDLVDQGVNPSEDKTPGDSPADTDA